MDSEIVMRQLTIKSYHVEDIEWGDTFRLTPKDDVYRLTLQRDIEKEYIAEEPLIEDISVKIIKPEERHLYINSVMDIIPISVKALGRIGEGITHTLTGVYVVLTGVDTEGNPVCAFGSSNGMMDEQIIFDRPGTPAYDDIIILFDVTLVAKAGFSRPGPNAIHHACDQFCQNIRQVLKQCDGQKFTEKNTYKDVIRPGKKKVAIVKMVSGQGAMYDTHFLGEEPSSFDGSRSIIDITGAPMVISPNEYRDGAIRALY